MKLLIRIIEIVNDKMSCQLKTNYKQSQRHKMERTTINWLFKLLIAFQHPD